jgi:hypothetical protein
MSRDHLEPGLSGPVPQTLNTATDIEDSQCRTG